MKKFTLILGLILVMQAGNLFAQTDTENVNFNAILESVLNLNVTGGADQTATFNTPDTYNFGIDAVGTTTVTVESTSDWNLQISAPNFTDGATATIPINNLGVWCEATGAHVFGTEVTCGCQTLADAMGLTTGAQMLIDAGGASNAGDASDNAFNLNWTMGTMKVANPNPMNAASIFDQLANGTIANIGTFTTTATLTLTAQ